MASLLPRFGAAQDGRATLEAASKTLGADGLKTIQYSASGVSFAVGQSAVPGAALPGGDAAPRRRYALGG
jgi:hypothetical protein